MGKPSPKKGKRAVLGDLDLDLAQAVMLKPCSKGISRGPCLLSTHSSLLLDAHSGPHQRPLPQPPAEVGPSQLSMAPLEGAQWLVTGWMRPDEKQGSARQKSACGKKNKKN